MAAMRNVNIFFKRTLDLRISVELLTAMQSSTHWIHNCAQVSANFGKDVGNDIDEEQNLGNISGHMYSDMVENYIDNNLVNLSNVHITEEELTEYPIRRFEGNIFVIKEPSNEHDSEILGILNKLKGEAVLGLDVEMTESGRIDGFFGRSKKTRVVQIASESDAVVWQLKNFARLPSSLVAFLKSDVLKVGHAISDDVVLLKKEFNIRSRCLFDTLPWAIKLNCKPLGLHALCAIFLGWRISKGLRTSDWNRSDLSENQIHYACTDAWASLMLYKKMKRVAYQNGNVLPLPIDSVNDILDTRLLSRRRRRSRHVQNNKARKNFDIIAATAKKVVE